MAFNQASFFLLPPRFGPIVVYDHDSKTTPGKPLELLSSEIIDPNAPRVMTDDLRKWFLSGGFSEKERYAGRQVLIREERKSSLGVFPLIDLTLPLNEEEISELYIRFLLTSDTPGDIPAWSRLIAELGHDFGFKIMDADHRLLPCVDFLSVLRENWNFRSFQKDLGWEI